MRRLARTLAAAAALLAALSAAPAPALALTCDVEVVAHQQVDVPDGAERTLGYRMDALDEGAPLPDGASGDAFGWEMTGNDSTALRLSVETPANARMRVWYYRLTQQPGDEDGIEYDDTAYLLELRAYAEPIEAGGRKTYVVATVFDPDGKKVDEPRWNVEPKPVEQAVGRDDDPQARAAAERSGATRGTSDLRLPRTSDLALGALAGLLGGLGAALVLVGTARWEENNHGRR